MNEAHIFELNVPLVAFGRNLRVLNKPKQRCNVFVFKSLINTV